MQATAGQVHPALWCKGEQRGREEPARATRRRQIHVGLQCRSRATAGWSEESIYRQRKRRIHATRAFNTPTGVHYVKLRQATQGLAHAGVLPAKALPALAQPCRRPPHLLRRHVHRRAPLQAAQRAGALQLLQQPHRLCKGSRAQGAGPVMGGPLPLDQRLPKPRAECSACGRVGSMPTACTGRSSCVRCCQAF